MNHNRVLYTMVASLAVASLGGCDQEAQDGPPDIMLGESACVECGMIISDERFATATVVETPRGIQPILFDDFNCQLTYEQQYPDNLTIKRWSRDYFSVAWIETDTGWFVKSAEIRSPMAAGLAFFSQHKDAEKFAQTVSGQVLNFESAWIQTTD